MVISSSVGTVILPFICGRTKRKVIPCNWKRKRNHNIMMLTDIGTHKPIRKILMMLFHKVDDKSVLGDVLKDFQKTENDFAEMITMENIYKKTIAYDLEKVVINEDGTTSHLHSDSFLDKHPERRETAHFTEDEEIEQANFMAAMTKRL